MPKKGYKQTKEHKIKLIEARKKVIRTLTCLFCGNKFLATGMRNKYCKECADSVYKIHHKDWYEKNRKDILEKRNLKRLKEIDKERAMGRANYYKFKDRHSKYSSLYFQRIKNDPEFKKKRNLYFKQLRESNPKYRLNISMSNALRKFLKSKGDSKRKKHWEEIVGYSVKQLREHLESRFDNKMNWGNYGSYWHIDHIIPKALFDYKGIEDKEFIRCWGLGNLQPLRAIDNLRKNKYVPFPIS